MLEKFIELYSLSTFLCKNFDSVTNFRIILVGEWIFTFTRRNYMGGMEFKRDVKSREFEIRKK